jgi:hypothetical protein
MVLVFARNFFNKFGMEWAGIDVVIDRKCDPCAETLFMLETTIGWPKSFNADCVFFDSDNKDSGKKGADIWKVFVNYIRRYV